MIRKQRQLWQMSKKTLETRRASQFSFSILSLGRHPRVGRGYIGWDGTRTKPFLSSRSATDFFHGIDAVLYKA